MMWIAALHSQSDVTSQKNGEAFENAIERHVVHASQNIPVRPHYSNPGAVTAQYNLGIKSNHSVFLQAIRANDIPMIDYFLHPENTFRRKQKLGQKAIYEATLQGNSDLVEQILSRGVRYNNRRNARLPTHIQESIDHARAYKIDPEYAVIEQLLLKHGRRNN